MVARWNKYERNFEDTETQMTGSSRTDLKANFKRYKLNIPRHPYLSNRYVINKIVGE